MDDADSQRARSTALVEAWGDGLVATMAIAWFVYVHSRTGEFTERLREFASAINQLRELTTTPPTNEADSQDASRLCHLWFDWLREPTAAAGNELVVLASRLTKRLSPQMVLPPAT